MASNGGILWFSVESPNWNELLVTGAAGENPYQFALRAPPERQPFSVTAVCASSDGRVAVGRWKGTIEIYARGGELIETLPLAENASECSFDQDLWVWSKAGLDSVSGPHAGLHADPPVLPKYRYVSLLALADHHVGLVESTEAVLYTLDQPTRTWERHPLAAPEFQAIRELPKQEDGASVPFFTGPTADAGDFYALSNGTNRKRGAVVLRFDGQGTLRARYLCPLPTGVAPPTATNPAGYLAPSGVAVAGRTLLLISSYQKAVVSYGIE
jgi:hypothetical protein